MPLLEIPVIAALREHAYLATEARGETMKAARIALLGRNGSHESLRQKTIERPNSAHGAVNALRYCRFL
jgi:hypothetical protein